MILLKQYILCLQELPVFKALTNNEFIEEICKNTRKVLVNKGDIIFHQGDEANIVFLVKSGMLKLVHYDSDGNEKIIDVIGPKEFIGETAFWNNEYEYEAIAIEDTNLCCYNFNHFKTFVLGNPVYAERIINYLGQKMDENMFRIKESEGVVVKEKLLKQLGRLANDHGELMEDGSSKIIKCSFTQKDLANMVGASRVMVNNSLKELKNSGLIEQQGRYIILKEDPCVTKRFSKKHAI